MSKTIKITNEVYTNLEAIREKRETFSDVVERLIGVYAKIRAVSDTLGPSHYLNKRPNKEGGA